ncbi:MAG: universal stress protein [Opitutaceae bacterium]|nr:universal stress protein [Opitutaceae bacterium]
MKRILVPVDLSGATVRVCNAAADLAKAVGGKLIILHVIPPPPVVIGDYYAFDPGQIEDLSREGRKQAAHKLKALGKWFNKRCPSTKVVMHQGAPVAVILRTARIAGCDYIVIGSHGHTAAYDLLIGSTTHGILRKAPCPVVVVPINKGKRKGR